MTRENDGYFHTGDGIRNKSIAFVTIRIYRISHEMRELPPVKSRQAVIALDTDKRISWTMLRDAGGERLKGILREAFAANGYSDQATIAQFLSPFEEGLQEGQQVVISYDSASKTTTAGVRGTARTATLAGVEAMQAVWSIWFGKSAQPDLADALISRI